MKKTILLFSIVSIFLASNTCVFALDNEKYQEKADAIFRALDHWFTGLFDDHTGIYNEYKNGLPTESANHTVIHMTSTEIQEQDFNRFKIGESGAVRDYYGAYTLDSLGKEMREKIIAKAKELKNFEHGNGKKIIFTTDAQREIVQFKDKNNDGKWDDNNNGVLDIDEIAALRCDGFVEYCFRAIDGGMGPDIGGMDIYRNPTEYNKTHYVLLVGQVTIYSPKNQRLRMQNSTIQNPAKAFGFNCDPDTNKWTNKNTVTITWSDGTDIHSGLYGYFVKWDNKKDTIPNHTDKLIPADEQDKASQREEMFLAEGEYYFHIRSIDKAGNWDNEGNGTACTAHLGPFFIDTTPPDIIFSLNGTAVKNNAGAYSPPVILTYAAKDNLDPEPKIAFASHLSPTTFTAEGPYTVTVTAEDKAGNKATESVTFTIRKGDDTDNSDPTYIQLSRQAPVDKPQQTPYQFSPQSSLGVKDTLEIDYKLEENSLVSILIYDSNDKLVRTLINNQPRNAASHIDTWDGKDNNAEFLPEGNYRFIINAVNALSPLEVYEITGEAIIDNTLPTVSIDFIKADTPQYGHYTAMGSVTDTHLEHYLLESLQDTTPTLIELKNIGVNKDILASFNGFTFAERAYTLRLTAKDFAGNSSISESPLIVDRTHNGLKAHINSLTKITDVGDGLSRNNTIFSKLKPVFQLMEGVLR